MKKFKKPTKIPLNYLSKIARYKIITQQILFLYASNENFKTEIKKNNSIYKDIRKHNIIRNKLNKCEACTIETLNHGGERIEKTEFPRKHSMSVD